MCRKLSHTALIFVVSLAAMATAYGDDVIWDFEKGNSHRFNLWSVIPGVPWTDDPTIAGDESLTGVGGHTGLPDAGVAWSIGRPDQYDGQKPAVDEGDKVKADGTMEYNQPGKNHPFTFPVNDRGQESYLNTYNLTQWGDNVHIAGNDQIASSSPVTLGENAVLTVWAQGGGSGTHAPEYDPDPALLYSDGSSGVAVISADDYTLLASVLTDGHSTLKEHTIDLSAFAGQEVLIEVVDAFDGSWGWLAVDEIQITNATQNPLAGFVVQAPDGELSWGFDQAQVDHLKTLGYDVQVIEQGELADETFTRADANALDLLIISESIGSSNADSLIGTSAPVMHQEAYGWDNWAFMGPADNIHWLATQTEVEVVNDTHPIMVDAGFSVGMLPWFTAPDQYTTENISNMAPGAELLCKAATEDEDSAVVFAVEKGAELANGSLAPNRRVGFSIPGNQDGPNQIGGIIDASIMSDEQWALYDAAIRWLDPPEAPPSAAMVVASTDLTVGFDQAQKDRLEMLGYEVTVATGDEVENSVFTPSDAEAFDVIVVSESISSSAANNLIGANVPMMHQESYGWSRHFFTAGLKKAWTTPINGMLDVVDDTHPIIVAAGLSAGSVQFFTDPSVALTTDLVASLVPGAVNLAQTTDADGNDVTCIFAIEAGTELANASLAANRIVGFSVPGNNSYVAGDMTDEAWALFDAAISWLDQ